MMNMELNVMLSHLQLNFARGHSAADPGTKKNWIRIHGVNFIGPGSVACIGLYPDALRGLDCIRMRCVDWIISGCVA